MGPYVLMQPMLSSYIKRLSGFFFLFGFRIITSACSTFVMELSVLASEVCSLFKYIKVPVSQMWRVASLFSKNHFTFQYEDNHSLQLKLTKAAKSHF